MLSKRMIIYFASIPLCVLALLLTYLFLWYSVATADAREMHHHHFKVTAITSTAEIDGPLSARILGSDIPSAC